MPKKIEIEITGDTKSLERALSRSQKAGNNFQKGMEKASKGALVALGAIGVGVALSVKSASDLEEQINKTRVVFRGSEKAIIKWSESTAGALGISQRAALEAAGTFGNMLVPMGLARSKAAAMSQKMVILAADMASFNNASPEETLQALRSGLAGETEPLRRFGVFLNEARVKQQAMNMGLYDGKGALSAAAKAQATYSIILQDTADAQGDFNRTSDSLANQQRILKAEFEDTAAALGTALLPIATDAAGILLDLVNVAKENDTEFKILVGTVGAFAGAIVLANTATAIYTSSLLAAVGATKALKIALATTPFLAVLGAAGLLAEHFLTQSSNAEEAEDAQRKLTNAVRDYHAALKEGRDAQKAARDGRLRLEAAEIAVQRAIQNRNQVEKDAKSTLLDRREADLNVSRALNERRDAEDAVTSAVNRQYKAGQKAQGGLRSMEGITRGLARTFREKLAKDVDEARSKLGMGRREFDRTADSLSTAQANAREYANRLRGLARQAERSNPTLADTARLAANLAQAWGRVVSLPQARAFVARFSVITTVETNRQFGGGQATGGPVQSNRYYVVGERGPEIFAPNTAGRIIPNGGTPTGGTTASVGFPGGPVMILTTREVAMYLQQVARDYGRANGGRALLGAS